LTDELLATAKSILADIPLADFSDDDVGFYNSKEAVHLIPDIPETADFDKTRHGRRQAEDSFAEQQAALRLCNDSYSEQLPITTKLVHAEAYVEILGQILRNFTGSLPGKAKSDILETTFSLALRSLKAQLIMLRGITGDLKKAIVEVDA